MYLVKKHHHLLHLLKVIASSGYAGSSKHKLPSTSVPIASVPLYDDQPVNRLLIDEKVDYDGIEATISNIDMDRMVIYNLPDTPTSYRLTVGNIWPHPIKPMRKQYRDYLDIYMQLTLSGIPTSLS